jgi:hypothetical protein
MTKFDQPVDRRVHGGITPASPLNRLEAVLAELLDEKVDSACLKLLMLLSIGVTAKFTSEITNARRGHLKTDRTPDTFLEFLNRLWMMKQLYPG